MAELSIKIKIGDREYPMKVRAEDEAIIRMAGKKVNEQIKMHQDTFRIDDKQDLLSMAAFALAVEKIRADEERSNTDALAYDQVQRINQILTTSI